MAIRTTGTQSFDADDEAGHDSSATNNIVRVNDTLTYDLNVNVNVDSPTETTTRIKFPKGIEIKEVPGFCKAGSQIVPPSLTVPALPTTGDSIQQLEEQELICNLGSLQSQAYTFPVTAVVTNYFGNAVSFKPVSVSVEAAGQESKTVPSDQLPVAVTSARPAWDVSLNGVQPATKPSTGYMYGPATEPCPWDKNKACKVQIHHILMSSAQGGKGVMPAVGDVSMKLKIDPRSLYYNGMVEDGIEALKAKDPQPDSTGAKYRAQAEQEAEAKIQKILDNPEKYAPRAYFEDYYHNVPGPRIGFQSPSNAGNSVVNSGNFKFNGVAFDRNFAGANPITQPIDVVISGADMSLRSIPSKNYNSGSAIPDNRAYAVSQAFKFYVPSVTIQEFGITKGVTTTLKSHTSVSDLNLNGFTSSDTNHPDANPSGNDYRNSTPNVSFGTLINKRFTGVPGTQGNMSAAEFNPGHSIRGEGPTGGAVLGSGGITVAANQEVLSQLEIVGTKPDNPGKITLLACDSWDKNKLHLKKREVPASTDVSAHLQRIPSGGEAVWISGYNNVLNGNKVQYATTKSQVPELKVQYAAEPGATGAGSLCYDDSIQWYDSPEQVPGNDATKQAQGIFTGVGRVRIHLVMPEPVAIDRQVGEGVRAAVSILQQVADSGMESGDLIPNYMSVKDAPGKELDLAAALAAPNQSTASKYTENAHQGDSGDRLIFTDVQTSLRKTVVKGNSDQFGKVPPAVTNGDEVRYKLEPTLTSPVTVQGNTKDLWVEDCLPASQDFVDAQPAPAVVQKGSTPDDAKLNLSLFPGEKDNVLRACKPNETYLRWIFKNHQINEAVEPIIFKAMVRDDADSGVFQNTAQVWAQGDATKLSKRTDVAEIQITNPAGIKLSKQALTPVVQVNRPDQQNFEHNVWRVRALNNVATDVQVNNFDIIDVLPRNNVGSGDQQTKYSGTFEFASVTPRLGHEKAGQPLRFFVTKSQTVPHNPVAQGDTPWCSFENGQIGALDSGQGECPANLAEVTGVRAKRDGVWEPKEPIEFDVDMIAKGNKNGDLYVNQVSIKAGSLDPLGPIRRAEVAVGSKIGDYTWIDENKDGLQTQGEPAIGNVRVTLTGTDDLGNPVNVETTTNDQGRYVFENLRSSDAAGYTVTFGKPAGYEFTNTGADLANAEDSNADKATGASQPVVLPKDEIVRSARGIENLTVDGGFVLPRQPFKVSKTLNANGSQGQDTFTVTYRCSADGVNAEGQVVPAEGNVEVPAGGETTVGLFEIGTTCAVIGEQGAERNGYALQQPIAPTDPATVGDNGLTIAVTNTYNPETGRFKVRKNVVGLPQEKTPAVFLIDYVCVDDLKRPGFDDVLSGTIELAAGEEKTSPELPRGIECAFAERVNVPAGEKGHIDVPGYLRAEPAFDHATVATAADPETAPEDMPAKAVVTNTYSVETGTFKVTKRVNGLPDEKIPAAFTISYTCTDPHDRPGFDLTGELNVANGGEVTSPALPLGATCELREKVDNNIQVAGFSLAEPVYSNQAKTVVTAHDPATVETARMEVTNNYSRDMGKIAVKKVVTVDGTKESTADARFGVLVECVDPVTAHKLSDQPHRLDLSGDGTAVEYADIPTGYVCSLSEEPAPRAGFTHVPSFDQQTVTINDKDQVVNVTVTNAYTRDKGGFKVAKMVTGNAAALVKDKTFTFRYECADNFTGTVTLKNGESKSVTEVPTGTCVVTEENTKVDNAAVTTTMQVNEGEFTETNQVRFEVTKDQRDPANTIKIAAINNYVADVAPFKVLKTATADENQQLLAQGLGDRNIVFDYTCTPAYEGAYAEGGEISVKPNGDAAISAKQYPIGTSCTLVEKTAGAQVAGFALEAVRPLTVEVTAGAAPAEVRAVNRYTRDKGGFTVTKRVDGNAAVLAQDKAFEFTYTCADGVTETFTLKHGEKKQVANIPTGDCTITEKAAEVAHTIPTTTIRINDAVVQGATATFRVDKSAPDAVITVDVTNTYAPVQAPFMVKKIASAALDNTVLAERIAERDFIFDYTCTPAYEGAFAEGGEIRVKAGGEAVASPKTYPIGTACTLVERKDSAAVAGFTHSGLAPLKVVVAAGENPAEVVAENRYTREEGTFGVVKNVKGWPWFSNETFTFDYTCKHPDAAEAITGQLKAKGDGITVESGMKLPFGTQCRVRENVEDAERFGFVLQAPEEIVFTITEDVPVATATAVNTYIPWIPILIPLIPLIVVPFIPKHEPPAPSVDPQVETPQKGMPKKGLAKGEQPQNKPGEAKQLAQTGVDESLLWIIAIGLALVAAGAVTLRRGQS
ncbi:DUF5979 domain-containing protein [Corynebacterium felinum]|uniref:LPXTG-motif cell wall-anchored protein n=1 Tax=Corynebacterium felinum TaxID=131318 RepID=A0ABU2B985_9CORY|nr:DUF5979 domain-containing protein [Corynebacterium felinum]MDF5820191.1 DUF5979 domain-containing protein [Corynebacterium felinum]MDR7353944.1 LPXTG-motif cell wall-anchored protein [Corynebacterium felinum]